MAAAYNRLNILGKKFGKLTPIKYICTREKRAVWLFKCDCGKEKELTAREAVSGNTVSCGCYKFEDLTGKKFNKLTAIKFVSRDFSQKYPKTIWIFECECGNKKQIDARSVVRGHTKTCGCFKLTGIPSLAKDIYRGAYDDGDISFNDFYKMSQENCYWCDRTPMNKHSKLRGNGKDRKLMTFVYNGLDRLNSNIREHTKENCVPCCGECNWLKTNYSVANFFKLIKLIYENHSLELKKIDDFGETRAQPHSGGAGMKKLFDPPTENKICDLYLSGESSIKLAKLFCASKPTILSILKRHNIARRGPIKLGI